MPQPHRDACCLLGSWAGRVLLNAIDCWLAPVRVRYLWLHGLWGPSMQECLSASLGPGCLCLALLFPPTPHPAELCRGRGLHARWVPVTGDSVRSELSRSI